MAEKILAELFQQGLLGVLLVGSLIVIFFLYKELKRTRESRLEDVKKFLDKDIKFRGEMKTLIQRILDLLKKR